MPRPRAAPRVPSYGMDAPGFFVLVAVIVLAELLLAASTRPLLPLLAAGLVLVFAGFHAHTSLRGKFLSRREVLDGLGFHGDERILDLGCGRGAVLLEAARRLSSGSAIGIDLWSRSDQSGNSAAATAHNAQLVGVAGRVRLRTANMTALPFSSGCFDVVTSSVVVHNIKRWPARQRAIDESVRVLRPGGKLVLADLRSTRRSMERLTASGMAGVARRSLGWRMWWTGPWAPTRLVTATKPLARAPTAAPHALDEDEALASTGRRATLAAPSSHPSSHPRTTIDEP